MAFWLLKSEPETFSIDDLKAVKFTQWDGVRNYQARNFMQKMESGEKFLFYHSSTEPPGVAGVGIIKKAAYADASQFIKGDYLEPRATREKPVWFAPDVAFESKFKHYVPLDLLRKTSALSKMELLKRGSRLSVQPVTAAEFHCILKLATAAGEERVE